MGHICSFWPLKVNTSEQLAKGLDEEEVEEEDWNEVIWSPEIQFKDFVNLWHFDYSKNDHWRNRQCCCQKDTAAECEEVSEESLIPSFQEALSGFESVRTYTFLHSWWCQSSRTGPDRKGFFLFLLGVSNKADAHFGLLRSNTLATYECIFLLATVQLYLF